MIWPCTWQNSGTGSLAATLAASSTEKVEVVVERSSRHVTFGARAAAVSFHWSESPSGCWACKVAPTTIETSTIETKVAVVPAPATSL